MSAVIDFPVKPEARRYLTNGAGCPGDPGWLAPFRRRNLNRFAELGFPSRRSESWRYLDLRELERAGLLPGIGSDGPALPPDLVLNGVASRFVLADGLFRPESSRLELPSGAWLGSMWDAFDQRVGLVQPVASGEGSDADHALAVLNAAYFTDGVVLDVAPGTVIDCPMQIVHLADTFAKCSFHTRSLINLGAGSRATVVETYASEGGRYWRNDVVAVRLGEGAHLTRIVLVEEGAEAIHTGLTDVHVGAGARFDEFVLVLGGSRVRHEANVCLIGEGASCDINGAYIVAGDDEANIVTAIDHAAPGGQTSELIKGVAAGRGHGAFQGKIVVRPHAQKTDARQMSRNLLLGRRAVIDTKPELEIDADDVKCAHGASVGDLDEASLFYLRARGIPPEEARRMLVAGFLREPIEAISDAAIREHLFGRLAARLATLEG